MKAYLQIDILVGIILALIMFVTLWFCYRKSGTTLGKFWRIMSMVFLILLIGWIVFMIVNTSQESKLLEDKISAEESADIINTGSTYGYCPYGDKVRTDVYGKNCSECSASVHGCCPDLNMLMRDVEGTNCSNNCLDCNWLPSTNGDLTCSKWTIKNDKHILEPCTETCCPPPQNQSYSMDQYNTYTGGFTNDSINQGSYMNNLSTYNTNTWDPMYQMMALQNQINDLQVQVQAGLNNTESNIQCLAGEKLGDDGFTCVPA